MEEPFVILIGGATGVGTSSVASKLSEIYPVRGFQRTDAIRQVLRTILGPLSKPELFQSTYRAYENIDAIYGDPKVMGLDKVLYGHIRQSEIIFLGIEGSIARDINERINSIYEGVHILPAKLKQPDWYNKQIRAKTIGANFGVELLSFQDYNKHIIELVIDVENPDQHKKRLVSRGEDYAQNRPSEKYLDNFDKIRVIRDFIVGLAKTNEIPVIQNNNLNETIEQCVAVITKKTQGKLVQKNVKL